MSEQKINLCEQLADIELRTDIAENSRVTYAKNAPLFSLIFEQNICIFSYSKQSRLREQHNPFKQNQMLYFHWMVWIGANKSTKTKYFRDRHYVSKRLINIDERCSGHSAANANSEKESER